MTDPGDRATTDANVRRDLPDATPDAVAPAGTDGEGGHEAKLRQNEQDEAHKASRSPDPLDK